MNRIAHRPLTLPKHPDLLHRINEMSIAIKIHHCDLKESDPEKVYQARARTMEPTWDNIVELLREIYTVINGDEFRENPVKY